MILEDQDKRILSELLDEAQGDLDSLDADIARLHTALAGVTHRLAEAEGELPFDLDIMHIDTVLRRLKTRRPLAAQRMMRLRSGLELHKKLPDEILAKIFIECADGQRVPIPRREYCMAWDLGQVCKRWRDVVRGEPLLWANINVHFSGSYYPFDLLHDVLSNCGWEGSVQLKAYPKSHYDWTELLQVVNRYAPRLRALDLHLDDACLRALSTPAVEFNKLEAVSLSFFESTNIFSVPILAFSASPNIRGVTLHLYGNLRLTDLQERMFIWNQLTDLTLTNIASTSVLLVLGRCPQLINLTVGLRDYKVHTHTAGSLVSLNQVQTISISHYGEVLDNLLSRLVLPSLKEFHMDGYGDKRFSFDLSGFIAFIKRSACSKTMNSLEFLDFSLDMQDILPVLRLLPSLTELVIDTTEPTPDSIWTIIQKGKLVMNLRKFEGCGFSSVDSAIRFLNSRWARTRSGNRWWEKASGSYDGLRDFTFWVKSKDYPEYDKEHFEGLKSTWTKDERRVQLITRD